MGSAMVEMRALLTLYGEVLHAAVPADSEVGHLSRDGGEGGGVVVLAASAAQPGEQAGASSCVGLVLLGQGGEDLAGQLQPQFLIKPVEVAVAARDEELELALPLDAQQEFLRWERRLASCQDVDPGQGRGRRSRHACDV